MGLFRVRRNGAECLRRRVSNAPEARCGLRSRIRRSAGHIFSLLREKIWKKRALERFYSAYAPEKACRSVLRFVVTLSVVRTPFGRAAEFLLSEIPLRQIFVPAKAQGICAKFTRRLSGFARFSPAVSIGCGRETSQAQSQRSEAQARSAISRPQRLFFAYFFLTSQKKVCPRSDAAPIDAEKWAAGGIPRLRRIRNGPAARFYAGWRKKPERGLPFPVSQFSESSRK